MFISVRSASAPLVGAAALMASSQLFAASAYDDVPGTPYVAYVAPEVPVYGYIPVRPVAQADEYAPVRRRARVYEYAPVRRDVRVYGYAPARREARVYEYAPARRDARVYEYAPLPPSAGVYAYAPVDDAEPASELRQDRRPLGTYAPSEPSNLSPSRAYFLAIERSAAGD